jgi:septum formation protein
MELILASASLRRQELLRAARIAFTVKPANVPEDPLPGESPEAMCLRLARDKATTVWEQLVDRDGKVVLGADTTVVVDGHILAKPEDAADATRMLRMLSGRTHEVVTGVCLISAAATDARTETTSVTFSRLSDADIAEYVATGEPMDKAGAYAIQGMASRWIPRVEGEYSNVVGLPVVLVNRLLGEIRHRLSNPDATK